MAVCVDRIISTAACLQEPPPSSSSPNNSRADGEREEFFAVSVVGENGGDGPTKDGIFNGGLPFSATKVVRESGSECRICQEEDEDKDLESPCACTGTLKVYFYFFYSVFCPHLFIKTQ